MLAGPGHRNRNQYVAGKISRSLGQLYADQASSRLDDLYVRAAAEAQAFTAMARIPESG